MNDTLFSVADQIVLVSGGSRGIGKAMAAAFAQRGAKVTITGRDETTLTQAAEEIGATAMVCDVADDEDIDSVVASFDRIDTLLNVAGVNIRKRVEDYTAEEYDFIVNINQRGAFMIAQAVGRKMIAQGSGAIVNVDSLNTYAPLKGVAPYAMAKAAMVSMTRSFASEWGSKGVRVNTIAPGFTLTDLTRKLWSDPKMLEWGLPNTPLNRLGEVEDMVGAAIFLASEASAFITGQVIRVDGGFSAGLCWPIDL